MIDAIQQVKALVTERRDHEQAIIVIDQQLAEIRKALGMGADPVAPLRRRSPRTGTPSTTWTGEGSATEQAVLAALAAREPQNTAELKAISATVPQLLTLMVNRGVLVRCPVTHNGNGADRGRRRYVYARSEAALAPYRAAIDEEEVASALTADAG